jgi:hypothetical protein
MVRFLFRTLWRLLILVLGIAALSFIVMALWPESNNRFLIFITLLTTYCLMTYFVIPNLMRLFHVFSRPNHIPLYVTTGDGWPSDPVNLAIIVKDFNHLEQSMNKAGWYTSDPLTFKNGIREAVSIALDRYYPEAPLSNLYLFDRPHDVGFSIPTRDSGSARTRHHVRFWRLQEPEPGTRNESHYHFWQEKLKHVFGRKREIWIGAATEDHRLVGVQWRTGQITHGVSHEADKERDFVIQSLVNQKNVTKVSLSEPGEQLRFHGQQLHFRRRQFRMFYISDGSIKIVKLK